MHRAAHVLAAAKHPVVLAGPGVARDGATDALIRFAERLNLPVATTFLGKGVFPDNHPNALGTIGFMVKDYANFGFDRADVVVAVGLRPGRVLARALEPDRGQADHPRAPHGGRGRRELHAGGGRAGQHRRDARRDRWVGVHPRHPRARSPRCVIWCARNWSAAPATTRSRWRPRASCTTSAPALGDDDIVLCDTGAVKMWMARLYPTYRPNTCLISNGLATMAFSLPGAVAAKLVHPERKVLAAMGDGAFAMSMAEIETAVREGVPFRRAGLGRRRATG